MGGANTDTIFSALKFCIPRIVLFVFIFVGVMILTSRINNNLYFKVTTKKHQKLINIKKFMRVIIDLMSIVVFLFSFWYIDYHYNVVEYIKNQLSRSKIYENYYIDPANLEFTLASEDGKKKNLIYIYLESMETTYASIQDGGCQNQNYIPNLTRLAQENISFSDSNKLGGFLNTTGTTWTFGGLLATSSGIPYSFPVVRNANTKNFAPGLTTMGDVLNDLGYKQMFLCGSDGDFAGRKNYFEQHGNYKVYDYYSAIEDEYINSDYKVFWGYEDCRLYNIAKDKLLSLATTEAPFNFTMLTVDTHFPVGYRCELCGNEFESETANIVSCADEQIANFIDWCKTQSFYEDTIIVITGDHPRMDNYLVENVGEQDRTIYNCFMNVEQVNEINSKNRIFTPMDIFPTVMSALGYSWEGNRIALGTNLFSNEKTLAEELGFNYFDMELQKTSKYYIKNFAN